MRALPPRLLEAVIGSRPWAGVLFPPPNEDRRPLRRAESLPRRAQRLGSETSRFWLSLWLSELRRREAGAGVPSPRQGAEGAAEVPRGARRLRLSRSSQSVAIIVSQDWDFGPAVKLAKEIAKSQGRLLHFESSFVVGPNTTYDRGVPGTSWVRIDKILYDACLDPTDYRYQTGSNDEDC